MFKTQNVSIIHNIQPRDRRPFDSRRRDDEYRRRYGKLERRPKIPFVFEPDLELLTDRADMIASFEAALKGTLASPKRADKPVSYLFEIKEWVTCIWDKWVGSNESPKDIQNWLKREKMPSKYVDVFSWDRERLYIEYDRLFKKIVNSNKNIILLISQSNTINGIKITYMKEHGFWNWDALDPVDDAPHLLAFSAINAWLDDIDTELSGLRKEVSHKSNIIALQLLAGILGGDYPNFNSIMQEECIVDRYFEKSWDPSLQMSRENITIAISKLRLGPIHDSEWGMHPKLSDSPLQ